MKIKIQSKNLHVHSPADKYKTHCKQILLPPDDVSPLSSEEEPDEEAVFLPTFFFSLALAFPFPLLFSESIVHFKEKKTIMSNGLKLLLRTSFRLEVWRQITPYYLEEFFISAAILFS